MRRKGARWTAGAAASVEYLATYSGNPITVNDDVADAETIAHAALDPQLLTGPWYMDMEPAFASSETTYRYIFAFGPDNHLRKNNTANQWRLRHNGTNYTWSSFDSFDGVADTLRFWFDPDNTRAGLQLNGGTIVYQTIGDVDFPSSTDLMVGQSHLLALPWSGTIYQPIAGSPP